MIKIEELRPFNLVHSDEVILTGGKHSEYVEVHVIDGKSEDILGIDLNCCLPHTLTSEQINGVPLTHEILRKIGFEKVVGMSWWKFPGTVFEIEEIEHTRGDRYFKLSINENEYSVGQAFRFVHELQNLFYCIEGKELEISL